MARLNEHPVASDSFDTLRRKFLRQNRDIARVNSNQSLRIRGLENECARLLSENLDLRGQVLRLEKELEENNSQRIAEHALQVKQKMEAQLIELGALIASFGLEPPPKRQSPSVPRQASRPTTLSLAHDTSSPQKIKPPSLSPSEAESLAAQEGRLPPIYENKTYPRQTLTRDEPLTLHCENVESMESPELGPPPVSRLFREDLRKSIGSPSKPKIGAAEERIAAAKTKVAAPAIPSCVEKASGITAETKATESASNISNAKQEVDMEKKTPVCDQIANTKPADSVPTDEPPVAPLSISNPVAASPASKTGAKRKFAVNDENAAVRGMKTGDGNSKTMPASSRGQAENKPSTRELKNPRSIRHLVSSRKDPKESSIGSRRPTDGRKPLAAKSTNEDVSSPRKRMQDDDGEELQSGSNATSAKCAAANNRMKDRMKQPLTLNVPETPLSPVVDIRVVAGESCTPSPLSEQKPANLDQNLVPSVESEAHLDCPSTPLSQTAASLTSHRLIPAHSEGRDTPPPADISSQGETSRPSRRARASVSYAEPNLRDKMRRPTKELFDAVAGEGKYVQRQQHHSQQSGQAQNQVESTKLQHSSEVQTEAASCTEPKAILPTDEQTLLKHAKDELPQAAAADRKNGRASSVGAQLSEQKPARASEIDRTTNGQTNGRDPYEFTMSSSPHSSESSDLPRDDENDEEAEGGLGKGRVAESSTGRKSVSGVRSAPKTARRSSTAGVPREASAAVDRHTKPSAARKRASMVSLKRGSMLDDDEDDPADSSYEPPAAENNGGQATEGRTMSTRDRISRRRSMML